MQRGLFSVLIALSIATACQRTQSVRLSPQPLQFETIYVGSSRTLDLDVFTTQDGARLEDATFSLPADHDPAFVLVLDGPLTSPPRLVFRPERKGDHLTNLSVASHGNTYSVVAVGKALAPLQCEKSADLCSLVVFDADAGVCQTQIGFDIDVCGSSDCVGDHRCRNGACTYVPRSNALPLCQSAAETTTLQPAWTFTAAPGRALIFSGVADTDGNLYALDCPAGDETSTICDAISVSPDGQLRWRVAASDSFRVSAQFRLLVMGHHLFVGDWAGTVPFSVRRLSDGAVGWEWATPLSELLAVGPNVAAGILGHPDATDSATVLLFDPGTGAEVNRLRDIVQGHVNGIVSDGQGVIYMVSDAFDGEEDRFSLSAVNIDLGLLWSVPSPNALSVAATDGARLYMSNGEVRSVADGRILYTGRQGDRSLDPVQQLGFMETPGTLWQGSCFDANLRRIRLADGVEASSCRLEEDGAPLLVATPLLLTRDGGAAFLATKYPNTFDPTTPVTFWWIGQDGNARHHARLDGLVVRGDWHPFAPPVVVGSRWITHGGIGPDQSGFVAYDVPDLALADHGWMYPGGNQARNGAPW